MIEMNIGCYDERTLERLMDKIVNRIENGDYKSLKFDIVMTSTQSVEVKDGVMTITGKVVGNGHEFEPTKVVVSDYEYGYDEALATMIFTKTIYDNEVENLLEEG